MGEKKRQRFHVPDLKPKVRTLEAIFGEKLMRSGLNPRTVDKWLREPAPAPYLSSLKSYFAAVGMKESDMIKSGNEFSKRVAEIWAGMKKSAETRYSTEEITEIYKSFAEGFRQEPILLSMSLNMMQKESIRTDYQYLKGYFHMYHYWKSGITNDIGKVRRNLIKIYALDEDHGLMNCQILVCPMRHLKKEDWWVYEGWVFNIKNKLFCLSESVKGMPPEIVTFSVSKPPFWPDPDHFYLYGILSALSLEGIPSASNIVLKKIRPDDELKDRVGYLTPEEIEAEGHSIDILDCIGNAIKDAHAILTIKPGSLA